MIEHTQTIYRLLPTNCVSVFDHFIGLALKGLSLQKFWESSGMNNGSFYLRFKNYIRSSHRFQKQPPVVFCKKGIHRNYLCQSPFSNKVAGGLQEHLFYRTPPESCFWDLSPTKRNILKRLASFFDPLRHLQPMVLHYKLLFQKRCKMKLKHWNFIRFD